ncbi:MAG: hypothetical protein ACLQVD_13890 [Capsulimonadaceae bacterium]
MSSVQASQTVSCVRATVATLVFLISTGTAGAATLVDPLNDFSQMAGHTANWTFRTDHPEYFGGKLSRLTRTDTNAASIVYHLQDIRDFRITTSLAGSPVPTTVEVSKDGSTWASLTSTDSPGPISIGQGPDGQQTAWRGVIVHPFAPIPPGCNYLRFTVGSGGGSQSSWTLQVEQVAIEYVDGGGIQIAAAKPAPADAKTAAAAAVIVPPLEIPGGFTALGASDSASIQWLPIQSASRYAMNRSDDEGASYKPIATDVNSTSYVDKGLKANQTYSYQLVGLKDDGSPVATETVSVRPLKGVVLMTDAFDDWGQADSHTDNVAITRFAGIANCVTRTSTDFGSVVYNVPGALRFAFTTYLNGDAAGQVSVDASPDGQTWVPVRLVYTQPDQLDNGGHMATVWAPATDLPGGTNYVRINLLGNASLKDAMDSPALAFVRVAYGASGPEWTGAAGNSSAETFDDPLTDWSKTVKHSDCLQLDGLCDKVKCIQRHGRADGSVVYHVPQATSFSFDMYYDSAQDEVRVESSVDGDVWAPVDLNMSTPKLATGDRGLHSVVTPKQPLPNGADYLRITFPGTWGVEIGGIQILSGSTDGQTPAAAMGTPGEGGLPTTATAQVSANLPSTIDPSTTNGGSPGGPAVSKVGGGSPPGAPTN